MKAHEAARFLAQLAKILREAPNREISELRFSKTRHRAELNTDEIALNVSTLLALSRISKRTWVEFIEENRWPIEVKARDSARNLIGKVLKYLESHPNALEQLHRRTAYRTGRSSKELLDALSSLLGK